MVKHAVRAVQRVLDSTGGAVVICNCFPGMMLSSFIPSLHVSASPTMDYRLLDMSLVERGDADERHRGLVDSRHPQRHQHPDPQGEDLTG